MKNLSHLFKSNRAWERGQELTVHGWIYGLHDGLLSDLNTTVARQDDVINSYETAIAVLSRATTA